MADGDISSEDEAASLAGIRQCPVVEAARKLLDRFDEAGKDPWVGGAVSFFEAQLTSLRREIECELARKAVDEVLGPAGPGPFPPSSGITRGGRAESMPVEHTEDGGR